MSLLVSLEIVMVNLHVAAAFLPSHFSTFIYIKLPSLQRGIKSLHNSTALLFLPTAQFPAVVTTSTAEFVSVRERSRELSGLRMFPESQGGVLFLRWYTGTLWSGDLDRNWKTYQALREFERGAQMSLPGIVGKETGCTRAYSQDREENSSMTLVQRTDMCVHTNTLSLTNVVSRQRRKDGNRVNTEMSM